MKLLDKILERSYRDYLQRHIRGICLTKGIDVIFKNEKTGFEISIKEIDYKDDLYKAVGYIHSCNYIYYIVHLEDLTKITNMSIYEYRGKDYVYEDLL